MILRKIPPPPAPYHLLLSFREVHDFHRKMVHFPGELVARWACVCIVLECRQGKCS